MILLNFGHPLTTGQIDQVEKLANCKISQVISIPVQIDFSMPIYPQIELLISKAGVVFQTEPCLVNLPSHYLISAYLLASLHGLWGYFPAVLQFRPILGSVPPRFDIGDIINLQAVRDKARTKRSI
jgi:hypothetical protein